MDAADRARIENLERAFSSLADVLEETIKLAGMGWTHWRGTTLQARVEEAKALLGESTITLPRDPASATASRRRSTD